MHLVDSPPDRPARQQLPGGQRGAAGTEARSQQRRRACDGRLPTTSAKAARWPADWMGATSSSGPLKPGPNPETRSSYARCVVVVVVVGSVPKSAIPSRSEDAGTARASMTASAGTPRLRRCVWTSSAHRAQRAEASGGFKFPAASTLRCLRVRVRCPRNPISAGSRVSAAVIGNKTAIDAAIAAPERTLTPTTNMPQRAMHTVSPAKSTARPAVAPAVVTASSTERPRRRPARARVRMNSE